AHRQSGSGATGYHDLEAVAAVVEQVGQRLDRRGIGDAMPVVDDDGDAGAALIDLVDQRCQDGALGLLAAFFERLPKALRKGGPNAANCLDEVSKEPHDVVVFGVDG